MPQTRKKLVNLPPRITQTAPACMAATTEKKACEACAIAKRRCGKETPHCLRCRTRGIECTYPPTKPTCFVLCGDDAFPFEHEILSSSTVPLSTCSLGLQSRVDNPRLSLDSDLPGLSSTFVEDQPASSWFTSPETWKIDRFLQVEHNQFTAVGLKRLMKMNHRWLSEWAEKGSNPFIHSQLYRTRFPRCVQDAYTILSCYLHKTVSNEKAIFQIIEDRAKQLLAEHGIPSVDSFQGNISASSFTLDSLEHIARVHALLIYQTLCLYDGDIRLRHVAESHIPVLNSWTQQMVDHASQAACLGASVISSAYQQSAVDFGQSYIALHENVLWYSWILAESIRRTWLVASGIQGTYLVFQRDRAVPCQGGMMFTTRQGVWEAQSALAWEKICSEVNVGLMQVAETDKLFTEVTPEDVNDFTMLILQATFGEERMERWGVRIQD